jgi:hypothetical protein
MKLLELAFVMATTLGVTMVDFDQSKIKLLEFAFVIVITPGVTKATRFHKKLFKVQQLKLLNNSPKSQW